MQCTSEPMVGVDDNVYMDFDDNDYMDVDDNAPTMPAVSTLGVAGGTTSPSAHLAAVSTNGPVPMVG